MVETRITAGAWRGRPVVTPRGRTTRPTQSLVREALFNVLGDRIVGAAFLDLYAGAGTVGFEALSRGATSCTFVERDRAAARAIAANAVALGCEPRCRVIAGDTLRWLRANPRAVTAADVCFLDAPYQDDGLVGALDLLGVNPPRLVVCEHHRSRQLPERVGGLDRLREYTYGLTRLSMLERRDHQEAGAP